MTLSAEDQDLLDQARQLVLKAKIPSVAFLQRHLKLEYKKALELLQMLEPDVVTPPDENGMRTLAGSGKGSPDSLGREESGTVVVTDYSSVARIEHAVGALMGLAIGDAVGTTLEFTPRHKITTPLTDMVGGGPFNLKPGQWTDDTSMALCLAESLNEHGFDMHDQLSRYLDWYERGYLSSTGRCFDIGGTTADALGRYRDQGITRAGSTDPNDAGNGSIMRLVPVVIYFQDDPKTAIHYAQEQSKTTHRAPECLMACQLMAEILLRALQGKDKDAILAPSTLELPWTDRLRSIADGDYQHKSVDEIRGTGYVVESLEAALWCFATTKSFEACVLAAANLGDDADTTAAVAGQIAGAFYCARGIPKHWQDRVTMRSHIVHLAMRLVAPH